MNRGGSKGCDKETNSERVGVCIKVQVFVVVSSKNAKRKKKGRGGGRALQKGTMMIHYFLGFC